MPGPLPWGIDAVNQGVSWVRGKPDSLSVDKIREASVSSWACSPNAAERDLGYRTPLPVVSQLEATASWYEQAGWL